MNFLSKIDLPMRTLLRWLAVAQLLLLTLVISGAVAYTHLTKSRMATQIAQALKSEILSGDYRDAILAASTAVGSNFDAITYERNDSSTVFSFPIGTKAEDHNAVYTAHVPISFYFGQQAGFGPKLGQLIFIFDRFELVPTAMVVWLLFLIVGVPAYWFAYKAIDKRHAQDLEAKNALAIARTTTMLAHDIRKPFSMLKMGLGMLERAIDPAGVKSTLAKVVPEIDRAMDHVNGMLEDLLEVGSTSTRLIQEPVSPETLIEQTLGDTFRVYPKANVAISYNFDHRHAVNAHVKKVGRVFSNIVGNAIQAMNYKGQIWFSTREIVAAGPPFIEFTLGNAGSVIPPENLAKLFDAFFTSGKKGGTGLGLAIAHKVVTAHGGTIWCESARTTAHPEGQVEFKFTLPIAEGQAVLTTAKLPSHSAEITKDLLGIPDEPGSTAIAPDATELALESDIIALAKAKGRPIRVLVVDDETIYRSALASSLARTTELATAATVMEASDYVAGIASLRGEPDLVITDIDMGHEVDGFDLVKAMRSEKFTGLICIHSNRMVADDHRTALDSGADAFIPKPMARAQLLKLVIQAGQRQSEARQETPAEEIPTGKPSVLVADDNPFIRDAWEDMLKDDAAVHTVACQEDLADMIAKDPAFLSRMSLVITDFHFDGSCFDGQDLARLIKKHRPSLTVLLSSDGVFTGQDLSGPDRIIGKHPVKLATLQY